MRIKYINVYVDTDVDVPISDIMEQLHTEDLIEELSSRSITPEEKSKLIDDFGTGLKDNNIPWSIQDDLKLSVIKEAFNKYTLEELENRLK
jgi:hypothetical protein